MKKTVRFGLIGLGQRGSMMLQPILANPLAEVTWLCDLYEDRREAAFKAVKRARGSEARRSADYRDVLAGDVDAVYIAADWEAHFPIALAAMDAGKAVALEVGGAYSVEDCWRLVEKQKSTNARFMFMENCCYDRSELLVTHMARRGVFGDVVHASGAYSHDLREEVAYGTRNRHYRLRNYLNRNCENYPTHELGPIAKILNIGSGNRMLTLSSFSSRAAGLADYVSRHEDVQGELAGKTFRQGDVVHTVITCAGGETIVLKLDTTLPRRYCRELQIRGTRGMYNMELEEIFLDGGNEFADPKDAVATLSAYEADYLPKVWREIKPEMKENGHGGMDAVMINDFVARYLAGEPFPIDAYDAASWTAVSALSEQSIALGGAPVPVPDFTNGEWVRRKTVDVVDFSEN